MESCDRAYELLEATRTTTATEAIANPSRADQSLLATNHAESTSIEIKLPSLPLPQASTQYEDWSFADQSGYNHLDPYTSIGRPQYTEQSWTPRDSKPFHRKRFPKSTRVYTTEVKCYICKQNHAVHACETLLRSTIADRIELVKKHRLCLNCQQRTPHSRVQVQCVPSV